jgi:glycosyltransferase involved in cell wall biosynthesis
MRLALVIYGSLDTLTGGYLYDRKLVEHLRGHGDHVEIISLPWRSYPRHLKDNFSPAIFDRLASLQVDALLQDELNHPSLFLLNRRLRKSVNYPIISIVHHLRSSEGHPGWHNLAYGWAERRYLSSVDGLIFNSQTTRRTVENLLGAKAVGIVAYPGGDRLQPRISDADIEMRAQSPALRLLFVGNLIPRKGLHILLDALGRLPADPWTLTVAGNVRVDLSHARDILRRVKRDKLTDQVHFTGALGDNELASLMKDSHVLVVPSSYEGYGIVYVEGMGYGLPAIGTTGGGAGEIITHDGDGFLIRPGDRSALAEHLKSLAADRPRLLEMSISARHRFLRHPTWDESMKKIRAFLIGEYR